MVHLRQRYPRWTRSSSDGRYLTWQPSSHLSLLPSLQSYGIPDIDQYLAQNLSSEHTHGLESSRLSTWDVIDIHTSLVDQLPLRPTIADLRHTLVRAILSLEEHHGGPVVGEILFERARRAGRLRDEIM